MTRESAGCRNRLLTGYNALGADLTAEALFLSRRLSFWRLLLADVKQSRNPAMMPPLERELCRELHQPRRLGANDMAKVGIFHLPIHRSRTIELRVVESVKSLQAELQ